MRVALLLAVLTLASFVWRLWLVRNTAALTVRVDEDGYLLVARALTGGPGGLTSENPLFRHVGYPLLLSPIYWFTQDSLSVYKGVLILNAAVNSLTLPLAYLAARRVFELSRFLSGATAVVVASIPAVVFYGEFAMTDSVMSPLMLAWLLTMHATVTATSPRRQARLALWCGLFVAALWLVHVRSVVIVVVHLAVFAVLALRRRVTRWAAVASCVGLVASVFVDFAVRALINGQIVMGGNSPSSTLATRLFTPFGLVHTVNWTIGQVWYLTVSTLGLAAIGGAAAVAWLRRREPDSTGRTVVLSALMAVTLGIAFFSAATLPDTERINLYAYARYVAFTAPLWIVIAVAALAEANSQLTERAVRVVRLVGAAAVILLGSAYVVVSYSGRLRTDTFFPFDAPEASALTNSWGRMRLAAVTAVVLFALVCLGIALAIRRTRLVALGAILLLSVAGMPTITANAAAPMAKEFSPGVWLERDAGVTTDDTVAQDRGIIWWVQANVQWEVHWAPVERFDSATSLPPADATVVVAPWRAINARPDWDGTRYGWRLIKVDDKGGVAIWRRS